MSEVDAHGNTKRDNLLSAQRQLKRVPKELEDLVELPDCMREYWIWFIRLSNRRPSGMGISAIPYSEMLAFFELMGIVPDPVEIEVIEAELGDLAGDLCGTLYKTLQDEYYALTSDEAVWETIVANDLHLEEEVA